MSSITEMLYGEPDVVANKLSGDSPPTDISSLRAALANALTRVCVLERKIETLSGLDDD